MVFTKSEIEIAKQITKAGFFILIFFVVLILFFSFISNINLSDSNKVNSQIKNNEQSVKKEEIKTEVKLEYPLSVSVPGFNINANVELPQSTNVEVLDSALSRGAVYYPGSGYPGSNNTLIFGHSTSFKVVRNKSYQIFNNIKNVPVGTLVYVKTQSATHIYRTRKVEKVSKYSAWISFKSDKPILTLATCDSFGKASDRWVLEADYVGVQ